MVLSRKIAGGVAASLVMVPALSGCGSGTAGNADGGRSAASNADRRDKAVAARAASTLRRVYGPAAADAPWYGTIKRVIASAGDVTVVTSLYPDSDAQGPASAICAALYGPGVDSPKGVTGARVLGSDGGVLKRC